MFITVILDVAQKTKIVVILVIMSFLIYVNITSLGGRIHIETAPNFLIFNTNIEFCQYICFLSVNFTYKNEKDSKLVKSFIQWECL